MMRFLRWLPRPLFASRPEFEHVDDSLEDWPDPDPVVHNRLSVDLSLEQVVKGMDPVSAAAMFGVTFTAQHQDRLQEAIKQAAAVRSEAPAVA